MKEIGVAESIAGDLLPDVELMHLLCMRRYYCHVWNTQHWTDSEFAYNIILFCVKICFGHDYGVRTNLR